MFGKNNNQSYFNKIKNSYIILAVAYVIFGLFLAIKPAASSTFICMVIGIMCLILSISSLITYFTSGMERYYLQLQFIGPALLGVFGLIIILNPVVIISILPWVIGIVLFLSGIVKLQDGVTLKQFGYQKWKVVSLFAIVSVFFGILMMINPFGTGLLFIRIVGIFFVLDGCFSIYSSILIKKNHY